MDIGQVLAFCTKKGKVQCEGYSKEDIKDEKGSYKTEWIKKNYKKGIEQHKTEIKKKY